MKLIFISHHNNSCVKIGLLILGLADEPIRNISDNKNEISIYPIHSGNGYLVQFVYYLFLLLSAIALLPDSYLTLICPETLNLP